MLVFTIKTGKSSVMKVSVPNSTKDILLKSHIELMVLEQNAPLFFKNVTEAKSEDEKKSLLKKITKKQLAEELYPYFLKVLEIVICYENNNNATLTTLFYDNKISVKIIEEFHAIVMSSYKNFTQNDSRNVVVSVGDKNEIWQLPAAYMKQSTLIEFLEAAQYEHFMQSLKIGIFESIANIMSVILRPIGEEFDEKISEGRTELMLNQNMDVVLQTAFFLLKQKQNCGKILTLFLDQKLKIQKLA